MRISIKNIEEETSLKLQGPLKWGKIIPSESQGIYIVVTPKEAISKLNFDKQIIDLWIQKVPNMRINNEEPTYYNLTNEIKKYWLKDEIILYVGKTTQPIQTRVNQYYQTEIGERKPHSGGYWIKTLSFLNDCLIYWAECDNPEITEEKILRFFHNKLSNKDISKENLVLPFANLEIHLHDKKQKIRKCSMLKKARI